MDGEEVAAVAETNGRAPQGSLKLHVGQMQNGAYPFAGNISAVVIRARADGATGSDTEPGVLRPGVLQAHQPGGQPGGQDGQASEPRGAEGSKTD